MKRLDLQIHSYSQALLKYPSSCVTTFSLFTTHTNDDKYSSILSVAISTSLVDPASKTGSNAELPPPNRLGNLIFLATVTQPFSAESRGTHLTVRCLRKPKHKTHHPKSKCTRCLSRSALNVLVPLIVWCHEDVSNVPAL